jgi:nickel-dependent lactate racemase
MELINLKYGRGHIPLEYDDSRFEVLASAAEKRPLSDAEIGSRLDTPIDSPPLEEIVAPGQTVLFVVPDATRQTAAGQVVNLLVRRLIANGTASHEIRIIFATGIHRKVTETEKAAILTPFIAQRIKTLDHDPRDLMQIRRFGETSRGLPVELNRALTEHDHVILVGGVTFHYFAGFTGGRKLICPGLASARTVSDTHKLAFDCDSRTRNEGVGPGRLDGNPVHEAFMEAVSQVDPIFAINTIVNSAGEATDIFCGNWISSHRKACEIYASENTIEIGEKRDLVIVSCGGYPFDINMIQAHKALEMASAACTEGGKMIIIAECTDGLGRDDFLNWFDAKDSSEMAGILCEKYQVNGQTAWSLLRKAERFEINILTKLDITQTGKMRLLKTDVSDVIAFMNGAASGYMIPNGAKSIIAAT